MATTVLDSRIFRDLFGTEAMRAVFSDEAYLGRCVEVEVALARAQARAGVIPEAAARDIAARSSARGLDLERLKRDTENVGYPVLPLVRQLAEQCGEAGRWVHWGATTQDIMDGALVLQLRAALELVEADLSALRAILVALARRYRDTPMAGRTHLQHALPVTFGYKVAVWLSMFDRHAARLAELRPRVLLVQFAGAAGTLASLGDKGLAVQAEIARELGLAVPTATWHVARDALADAVLFLGLVTGSLGKIALDVMLMMQNEIAEAFEPFAHGRGASSTMPQKRNPISCELILAAGKAVRQHGALMLDAMVQDFERATGPWHAEWIAIPESFVLASGALAQAKFMLGGLIVDEARMRRNLDVTSGLIVAEAAMMALAPYLGRQEAHDVVYDACRSAAENGRPLGEVLGSFPAVTKHLSARQIAEAVDPVRYLGAAQEMVDRVLRGR